MRTDLANLEPGLAVPARPVLVGLLLVGPALYALSIVAAFPWDAVTPILTLSLVLTVLSLAGWFLTGQNARIARWYTVLAVVAAVYLASALLGLPACLALLALPTVLAASMLGLPGATVVAAVETLPLLAMVRMAPPAGQDVPALAIAGVGVWAGLGLAFAVYSPIYQVVNWWQAYYRQAQNLLEAARDRQVELKQALEDLAQANLQLSRLNALAQRLREEAESARRAKEHFVANVSHEMRTPLNMIIGFSEIVLQSPDTYGERVPAPLLADLAVVYRNAEHLKDLIDDVLDLSQIEADQMTLTREHIRFEEILEAATVAVRPLFKSKGLYLSCEVDRDLPPVFCDPTRIREVLLNLLGNAGRYTERGGVLVRVWQELGELLTSVQDTGPGIAPTEIDKLFQPFQQLDGSIRQRFGGSGLGLSISKRFIELHGGKIWVESQPGTGTTFSFRLPIELQPPPAGSAARSAHPRLGVHAAPRAFKGAPARDASAPRGVRRKAGHAAAARALLVGCRDRAGDRPGRGPGRAPPIPQAWRC